MLCHRCGARNPEGINFCPACGASQVRDASEDTLSIPVVDETTPVPSGEGSADEQVDVLLVNSGPSTGARFEIESHEVLAGRKSTSDIFLDDVTVSREHARFFRTDSGRIGVRDLGSLNGTYVNRIRVDEKFLNSGDEIQIGKFKLIYIAARNQ